MNKLAGIRAVTFDVGNTMIQAWPSVGHIYAEVAAAHGHAGFAPEELNRRFRNAFQAHGGKVNTKAEWAWIVAGTFAGLLPKRASDEIFPDLYDRFTHAHAWRVFEDVAPTLRALGERGLKLGVISNWDDRLRPLLHTLQLADWFDVIVVSCEVGASKPASAIFERAVQQLQVSANTILHVGDSFEADVAGANAAGLQGLQIDRRATKPEAAQVSSLLELLPPEGTPQPDKPAGRQREGPLISRLVRCVPPPTSLDSDP
jgi:putative hydrolase of the HAD superfamily